MLFLAGAAQAVLTIAWWLAYLIGRYGIAAAPALLPPPWAHAFLMIYGFFPFFILGFLMTAMPNWLNRKPVARRHYAPAALAMAAGMALFYPALSAWKTLLYPALALYLAGWAVGFYAIVKLLPGPGRDKRHPLIATLALGVGWLAALAYALGLISEKASLAALGREVGIWFFLLPIFVTVSHRMIPFFTNRVLPDIPVIRPYWALALLLTGAAGHGGVSIADLPAYRWLFDLPALVAGVYLTATWKIHRSFTARLLAVLHVGFLGLNAAFLLYAVQSFTLFAAGRSILGLAPLHLLTIGYFSAMVIAMASRVSLGHSGRPLVADTLTWTCFLGLTGAAWLRAAADLPGVGPEAATSLIVAAAVLWLASAVAWVLRYAPLYLKPRADGKPG